MTMDEEEIFDYTELPERSYGADCRIYMPENPTNRFMNVYDTLFDEFVLAHIFGWWGKAIMFRNQPLLWVLSIGFELMELTFRHMLPNFNECWWDSIVLDILICNWFGYCRETISRLGFVEPMPIQSQGWPMALKGMEVMDNAYHAEN